MGNMGTATKATAEAMDSAGSSMAEQEVYANSLEGKINTLKNKMIEFWSVVVGSDSAKVLIDALIVLAESFVENADSVANFIEVIAKLVEGLAWLNDNVGLLDIGIGILASNIAGRAITAISTLSGGVLTLGTSMSILTSGGIALILVALMKLLFRYQEVKQAQDDYKNAALELNEVSPDIANKINSGDWDGAISKIDEATLSIQNMKDAFSEEFSDNGFFGFFKGDAIDLTDIKTAEDMLKQVNAELKVGEEQAKKGGIALGNAYKQELLDKASKLRRIILEENTVNQQKLNITNAVDAQVRDLTDSEGLMAQAIAQSSKTGLVSKDVMNQLLKVYPHLQDEVILTADGYKIEQTTLKNLNTATINQAIAQIKASREKTNQTITDTETRIRAYIAETFAYLNNEASTGRGLGFYFTPELKAMYSQLDQARALSSKQTANINALNGLLGSVSSGGSSGSGGGGVGSGSGGSSGGSGGGGSGGSAEQDKIDLLSERAKLEEEIKDAMNERKQKVLDTELDTMNQQIEALKVRLEIEDEHNKIAQDNLKAQYELNKKNLETEKERYETEKDKLQMEYDARQTEESINDIKSDIESKQQRIAIISKDKTRASEVADLNKEIADLQKQLTDELLQTELDKAQQVLDDKIDKIDLEQDALSNNYDVQQKLIDSTTESNKNSLNSQIEAVENQQKQVQANFDFLLTNSDHYWNEIASIIKSGQAGIINYLKETDAYREAGRSQREAYVSGWNENINNIKQANGGNVANGYADGGKIDYTGLAMVHGGTGYGSEYVLNQSHIKDIAQNGVFPSFMKSDLSKFAGKKSNTTTNNSSMPITINVAGNVSNPYQTGQQIGDGIMSKIKKYTGNNQPIIRGIG